MTDQFFYHFDRRLLLATVIGWKKIFKNNRDQLNGFFMWLGIHPKAKEDFGEELI